MFAMFPNVGIEYLFKPLRLNFCTHVVKFMFILPCISQSTSNWKMLNVVKFMFILPCKSQSNSNWKMLNVENSKNKKENKVK